MFSRVLVSSLKFFSVLASFYPIFPFVLHCVPYPSYQPNLAYNRQLSVLEVVGDYWSKSGFHLQLDDSTGKFTQYQNSFYTADLYSTIVYSENVGTICIGGKNGGQNVYIITQNENWNLLDRETENSLSNILSTGFKYFGSTSNQNSIYLVGGTGSTSASGKVQMIDFDQVSSLTGAQSRTWVMLGFLRSPVEYSTVQFVENQLFVVGRYQNQGCARYHKHKNVTTYNRTILLLGN